MSEKLNIKEYCYFPKIDEKVDYVGLRIEKNNENNQKFKFNFPVCYYTDNEYDEIDNESLKKDIQNLLKAIYNTRVSEIYSYTDSKEKVCPIDSYLWIIRDYLENGYYIETETIYSNGVNGKINWKKTIKNNKILLNNDFSMVYAEHISRRNISSFENVITNIHKYCVYEAFSRFGFIFGYDSKNVEKYENIMNTELMIQLLKNEYINCFLDYKKQLIVNMINMLEWLNNQNVNYDMFSIESNRFEYVFQNLIDERFGNVLNKEEYYPVAKWYIKDQKNKDGEKASHLMEDTILDDEKIIYIIDSKYYKYEYYDEKNTTKLPQTSDIAKQAVYGQVVRRKFKKDICNIFFIPYNAKNKEKYIEYIGYAKIELDKDEVIYTLKIDLKTLVNDSFGTKEKNIKELKRIVKKHLLR